LDSLRIGVACYPSLGGSGVVATELAAGLAERGHAVHLFTFSTPHREAAGVSIHLVNVFAYPLLQFPPYDLALASKIVDTVQRIGGLDILHVHYAVPHAISAFLAKQMLGPKSFRTVTTLHGTDISIVGSDPAYATVTRFGIDQSDGVTAVSDSLRAQTQRLFGVPREIVTLPNFVDLKVFQPATVRADPRPTLVHASNFRPVKRAVDVVKIFAQVHRAIPDARLVLLGEGPDKDPAMALARELGVHQSVEDRGAVQIPSNVLAQADLLLLPSETESFGLVALEAMACSVPVLASRVGGLPEVIADGVSGRLFEVGDVNAFATAAIDLLQNPERRRAMGAAGRARAESEFSKERVVERYVDYYRKVIARQDPAAQP